ncbi:MAG: ATP-binding protein [Muribaculum sp.]|nr:ATP-binding protein [Muribaculum sp.]
MTGKIKYPIGIQDFSEIINKGSIYIDKTKHIKLLLNDGKYFFLSRPRRFGKSLFLSTLQAYFEGRRELFKGLDIDSKEVDWTPRPVIKLSLNTIDPRSEDSLTNYLGSIFREYENIYNIPDNDDEISRRFEVIINTAFKQTGRKVAILIDEYDAPLLNTLENDTLNNSYRNTLRSVFSVLKNADACIEFAFITGVSRFSHTSLFSGANNLKDISLENKYAAICGITEEELKTNLMPGIHDFAESIGVSDEEMFAMLKDNYDGYHFSKKSPDIYNPFSLLNSLQSQELNNYWFQSGTPSYLISTLKRNEFFLPNLDCVETVENKLSASGSYLQNPISLMYETGYLTIKDFDCETEIFTLTLPNKEVTVSFSEALLPIYSGMTELKFDDCFVLIKKSVMKGEADNFMRHLQTFFQGNPYALTELDKRERYFQNNIFLIFRALGFRPRVEEQTCNSRMDVMLRTRRYIYIFEMKTDGSTDKAMRQIDEKGYALPYLDEGLTIIKIAANYSTSANNIDSWEIEIKPSIVV